VLGPGGEAVREPEVRGRGVAGLAGREGEVAAEGCRTIAGMTPQERGDRRHVEAALVQAVRRWFRREGGRRPGVQVVVLKI
jgi:hypothetical protein